METRNYSELGEFINPETQSVQEQKTEKITGKGWIRIAQTKGNANRGFGILGICNTYNDNSPCALMFTFSITYRNAGDIRVINKYQNLFSKARIVYNLNSSAVMYIDVYHNSNGANIVHATLSNQNAFELCRNFVLSEIPTGYTAKEFEF